MKGRIHVNIVVLLIITVAGCAGRTGSFKQDVPETKIFWTHRYQYVRLEPRERCGEEIVTANTHPATLAGDQLKSDLALLRIEYPDEEKSVPVFSRKEMALLIDPLIKAFESASPDEDITLVIEGVHPGAMGYQRAITTARLFLQEGELHLVFGKLHDPIDDYDSPLHMEPTDHRVKPFMPGSRCQGSDKKFPILLSADRVQFFGQGEELHKNWLVIKPAGARQPKTASGKPEMFQTPLSHPQTGPPAAVDFNQTPKRLTPAIQVPGDRSIEEKLHILKKLREKGLISEEEYKEKKREILDTL